MYSVCGQEECRSNYLFNKGTFAGAQIRQLESLVAQDQYVLGLDVAVEDLLWVHVVERFEDVVADRADFVHVDLVLFVFVKFIQVAVHELEHQGHLFFILAKRYIIASCKAHPLTWWYWDAPESSTPWSPCPSWFCSETHTCASLFSGPPSCQSFFTLPWTPRCKCLRLSWPRFCSPPFFIIVWQNLWKIIIILSEINDFDYCVWN